MQSIAMKMESGNLYLDIRISNKNNVYVKNKYYDIILLGDSFTKGSCVDLDKDQQIFYKKDLIWMSSI